MNVAPPRGMLLLAHLDWRLQWSSHALMERLSHQRQKKKMSALSVTQRDWEVPAPTVRRRERELGDGAVTLGHTPVTQLLEVLRPLFSGRTSVSESEGGWLCSEN